MRITATVFTCLLVLSGFPPSAAWAEQQKKIPKQLTKLLAMTPSDFERCTTIKDDQMEAVATFTTSDCFQETQGC